MKKGFYILFFLIGIQLFAVGQESTVNDLLDRAEEIVEETPLKSIELTEEAFDLAEKMKNMYLMVSAKATMGYIGMMTNDYEASYINYTDALEYLVKSDTVDLYLKITILNNLAMIKASYGDHAGASNMYDLANQTTLQYVEEYREEAEEYGDLQLLIDMPYNMAIELRKDGQYEAAGDILLDLWEQSEFKKDTILLAQVLNELGQIKYKNGEFNSAIEFFATAAFNENVNPEYRAIALHNLANSYMEQKDLVKADKYYTQALELKLEHSSERSQFITMLDQGELYFEKGDNDEAIIKWETAVNTFDGINNDPDMFIVYDWLQKAYRSTDLNKSIEYSDLYAANFKNWMTVQSSQQDSAPTLQAFNTRIDTILADRALKAERLALLRQYWPLGVVALLLIMLFVYVVQLSYNKRREKVLEASLKADRATVADEILNRIRRD